MAGVYNGAVGSEYIAKVPPWSPVGFNNGSSWFNKNTGTISGYSQKKDMKQGLVTTQYTWTANSHTCAIDIQFFIRRSDPHLAVIRYAVTPQFSGKIWFNAPHFAGYGLSHLTMVQKDKDPAQNMIWLTTKMTNTNIEITQAGAASF